MGTSTTAVWGAPPIQTLDGVLPIKKDGVSLPRPPSARWGTPKLTWDEVPPSAGWGTSLQTWDGVPPASWMGYPPPES